MSGATQSSGRAWRGARGPTHARLLLAVALLSAGLGALAYLTGAWAGIEHASVDTRFALRGTVHPDGVVVVGVDNRTLNTLEQRWPFPRSLDARAVEALHRDGAGTIVYDAQFTQPTVYREDLQLYEAVARAGNVILATTEIGPHGETKVLGGEANLARAHARAAAANFRANSTGVLQRYLYSVGGVKSIAVMAAEQASGRIIPASDFDHGAAWIDFPGPVGTVPTVSFSDLVQGRVPRSAVAGKIVVIGATSPVLQDIHATSVTASTGMSGPEVQADSIWTALHGNPLRDGPLWLALLTIVLAGLAIPLSCLTLRPGRALLTGVSFALAYTLLVQLAFGDGVILVATYPLATLAGSTLGAGLVSYFAETWERQMADRYGAALEDTVRRRTAELSDTQLEVISRLAQAAELRDENTGAHIERVGRVCERLALELGMSAEDAERLRIASTLHDVGKIGVPDRVLLKRGELDEGEWEEMKAHTTAGAALLAGSRSPLLQMAEVVARTHHERWDGSGYPYGLRGDEIPLVGRICAICDVFDALCSEREYKAPWPLPRVVAEIERKRGSHFDPAVVDAFLRVSGEFAGGPTHASARAPAPPQSPAAPHSSPHSSPQPSAQPSASHGEGLAV